MILQRNVAEHYGFTTHALSTHASGNTSIGNEDWDRLQKLFFCDESLRNSTRDCPELTIVTWSNRSEPTLLANSLSYLGVRDLVVLRPEPPDSEWRHAFKVSLLDQWLPQCKTEYVLAFDADDVLVFSDPAEMLRRFRSYDCQILFTTEPYDWPPHRDDLRAFEQEVINQPSGAKQGFYGVPFEGRYINSGGFIAHRDYLAKCAAELMPELWEPTSDCWARIPWDKAHRAFDDQLAWRMMHKKYYPDIRADDKSLIFSHLEYR
jgi:hypothetical protein